MSYGSWVSYTSGGDKYLAPSQDPNAYRDAMFQQRQAYLASPERDREMFERGLQSQEQQRRAYDSETARQSQQQKYGILGGLLGTTIRAS